MSLSTSILLLVPAVLQIWLAIVLVRGGLRRIFVFFFSYTVFAATASLLKFAVQWSYRAYFIGYWVTEAGYAVLSLLAILELFPHVFKAFSRARGFRVTIWAVVLLMTGLSVLKAILNPPIQAGPVIATIASLEIAVRYVQAGVFVLLVLLAGFYRIWLRRYVFGIAFGFGLVAASRLLALLLRSDFGTRFRFLFTFMPGVVYIIAVLIWLLTFLRPEPPDPLDELKSPLRPEEVIERVRRLSRILKGRRDDTNLLASAARWAHVSRLSRS